jgi:hypothetical protein
MDERAPGGAGNLAEIRKSAARILPRPQPRGWIALASALVSACASTSEEPLGTASSAIYGGVVDNDGSANAAVVALRVGDSELCTGALIAPNVVLTARHCVSEVIAANGEVECTEDGTSKSGEHFGADHDPKIIQVFTGENPNLAGTPIAKGKAIFHPTGSIVCNSDIAILVLDRGVGGIKPLRVRLSSGVKPGETIRAVGYGKNDKSLPPPTRLRKDNVPVLAIGKAVSANGTRIATREFETGLSICQGDSGGPGISAQTGAVVGVVSRGLACHLNYGHIYTATSGFKELFDQAFKLAGGALSVEDGVDSGPEPGELGAACNSHDQCLGEMCLEQGDKAFCSRTCISNAQCPSGFACLPLSGSVRACGLAGDGAEITPINGEEPPGLRKSFNLKNNGGQGCSASGAPSPEATSLGGVALGMLVAVGLLFAHRKRGTRD